MMPHMTRLAFACAFSIFSMTAMAQGGSGALSDDEIALIVGTALREEIATAELASRLTTNDAIKSFAEATARTAAAENKKIDDMPKTRNLQPQDDALSQSLRGAATEQRNQLAKLTDTAFDRAYADNEMLYDQMIIGILDVTALPSAKDGRLKAALETSRAFFKLRLAGIEALARRFK